MPDFLKARKIIQLNGAILSIKLAKKYFNVFFLMVELKAKRVIIDKIVSISALIVLNQRFNSGFLWNYKIQLFSTNDLCF